MQVDAVIIGAGACGLMCAIQAGYLGKQVLLLERNGNAGAKILISGGGRCNYTNLYAHANNFISQNPHFCKSALAQWSVEDTISFFESLGISGSEKTLGQLFPESNKAKDIVNALVQLCLDLGQQIYYETEVTEVTQVDSGFRIKYQQGGKAKEINAPKVVLASGGLPVKKLGASDFALRVAKSFGLKVVETAPALVPLSITGKDAEWFAQLSGNSIFCRVSNAKASFEENILFTHRGLSGPAILQISSYWQAGESIDIDLFPAQNIIELIQKERSENPKKLLSSFLGGLYTRKFAEALDKFLPIHKNLASLSNADFNTIEHFIHQFSVKPAGDLGYDKAEVMRGGVDTHELYSKSLEAKSVPGLYFGGECVDVTGWLGGYNFQWAWASAFAIAQNV